MIVRALAAFLIVFGSFSATAQIEGSSVAQSGDTLFIDGVELRLNGLDSPGPNQVCGSDDDPFPCGSVARTALMDLVFGAAVSCRILHDSRMGPKLAECHSGGFDLGASMVHTGWVRADRETGRRYRAIEEKARKARRGLWRRGSVADWRDP